MASKNYDSALTNKRVHLEFRDVKFDLPDPQDTLLQHGISGAYSFTGAPFKADWNLRRLSGHNGRLFKQG